MIPKAQSEIIALAQKNARLCDAQSRARAD
jgi:hypothetical protein